MRKAKLKPNILALGLAAGLVLVGILFHLPFHERWY